MSYHFRMATSLLPNSQDHQNPRLPYLPPQSQNIPYQDDLEQHLIPYRFGFKKYIDQSQEQNFFHSQNPLSLDNSSQYSSDDVMLLQFINNALGL